MAQLGAVSYDEHDFGTAWWHARANDPDHQAAYATIAELLLPLFSEPPAKIVDYACGTGMLLAELVPRWPTAQLTGIDESQQALAAVPEVFALRDLSWPNNHVALEQAALPAAAGPRGDADLVFFVFPDFRCEDAKALRRQWKERDPELVRVNKQVRKAVKQLTDEEVDTQADTLLKRLAGLDCLRRAKPGGLVVRVEYAYGSRDECDEGHMALIDWWSGAMPVNLGLGPWIGHVVADRLQTTFVPSNVIDDVHAQQGITDADDGGGFLVEVYRAR